MANSAFLRLLRANTGEGFVILRCEVVPFQMVRQNSGRDPRRPQRSFFDAGGKLAKLRGKICDCAVVEESPGLVDPPKAEDFGIRKTFGNERISARSDGLDNTDAKELMVGGRDNYIGIAQHAAVFVVALLIAPVVDVVLEVSPSLCENFGLISKALAENADSESHIPRLENSERLKEAFRILIVFPPRGPKDAQGTRLSLPPQWNIA